MTAVVLVHGLLADGSCWSETITELHALGHESVAARLALQSMADDIAAVRRTLATVDGPVLLVGWSYGGAVITNAARGQNRVKALAYTAAFVPDEGESVSDLAHRHPGSLLPEHLKVTEDGHSCIDRAAYGEVVAADAPGERTALAGPVQKLPRLGLDQAPSGALAWRDRPSHSSSPPTTAPCLPPPSASSPPAPPRRSPSGRPGTGHVRPPEGTRRLPGHHHQEAVTSRHHPCRAPVPGRGRARPLCPFGCRGHRPQPVHAQTPFKLGG